MNAVMTSPAANRRALTPAEIDAGLAKLQGWALKDGAIEKTYLFRNYYETLAFVNALAFVVHREDHHPDLVVTYNRCTVRFNTHDVNGISVSDFDCAAKADAL
jgi:4a-hydroxytetrahydrobiopterin dehydratase